MNFILGLTILCAVSMKTYVVSAGIVPDKQAKQNIGLWNTLDHQPPVFAAHRGEKVLMPEHTVAAYEIAAIEGADYVEPDLVLTQDGHFVCSHDLSLRSGTNVADLPQFASKMTNLTLYYEGGFNQTIYNDWFVHNFTLAELKQLRVKQVVRGIRPQYFNDMFEIPTFSEYLNVIHKMSHLQSRPIGIIPELKDPHFHNSLWSGNYMEDLLLNDLKQNGYPIRQGDVPRCNYTNNAIVSVVDCGHVLIQSFELASIQYLHTQTDLDLLKLISNQNFEELTYDGIEELAAVSKHIHIGKELLYTGIEASLRRNNYSWDRERIASLGGFVPVGDIVKEIHAWNVRVGIYTIPDSHENSNHGCDVECQPNDKQSEMFYYFEMGVDAFFVENVPEAVILRLKFDYELQMRRLLTNSGSKLDVYGGGLLKLAISAIVLSFIRTKSLN